jgi:hypothetical protein
MAPDEFDPAEDFPSRRAYTDCTGQRVEFEIRLRPFRGGYVLTAHEVTDEREGYVFEAFAETDPYFALGDLHDKISRHLATRYLAWDRNGKRYPSHDTLVGRVSSGGVVVDGEFVPFSELEEMIQTYEGFAFKLEIKGSSGDL